MNKIALMKRKEKLHGMIICVFFFQKGLVEQLVACAQTLLARTFLNVAWFTFAQSGFEMTVEKPKHAIVQPTKSAS